MLLTAFWLGAALAAVPAVDQPQPYTAARMSSGAPDGGSR